ncbi:MAG TPA: 50S ribosomal protein L23 [Bacteroidia bacterium]|jgi:large subunit ribosomal protein L23|nr:50S ribosomal protein L23 [Bacteroidia bacterium]
MKISTEIIIKPIITEKYLQSADKLGQYAFVVDKKANKYQIKNAIEKLYDVKVDRVNTQQYIGKVKMRNTTKGLAVGRVNRYKKAIVTLKDGYNIDIYANI